MSGDMGALGAFRGRMTPRPQTSSVTSSSPGRTCQATQRAARGTRSFAAGTHALTDHHQDVVICAAGSHLSRPPTFTAGSEQPPSALLTRRLLLDP
jgi:hypothetical protein